MHQQWTMMKWKHFTPNKKSSTVDKKVSSKKNGTNFGTDALKDWKEVAGSLCNEWQRTKDARIYQLQRHGACKCTEHKDSQWWTWQASDYILVQKVSIGTITIWLWWTSKASWGTPKAQACQNKIQPGQAEGSKHHWRSCSKRHPCRKT